MPYVLEILPDPSLLAGPAAVVDVAKGFIFFVFILTAILLSVVILVQEGKGGGLGGAFGGAAAESFGVKAGVVNRFTAWLAGIFLGLALLYAGLSAAAGRQRLQVPDPVQPLTETEGSITPVEDGGAAAGTTDEAGAGDETGTGDAAGGEPGDGDAAGGEDDGGAAGADADEGGETPPPADGDGGTGS